MLTKQQQFQFIDEYASQFSITLLLKLTDVSKSGYYKWKKMCGDASSKKSTLWEELIVDTFNRNKKIYGVQRIKK